MKRRAFLSLGFAAAAPAAQSIRSKPTCPTCHTPLPQGTPPVHPVIAEENGDIGIMTKVYAMFCSNCGTQFICTP